MVDVDFISLLHRPAGMTLEQMVLAAFVAQYGAEPNDVQWEALAIQIAKAKTKKRTLRGGKAKRFIG